MRKRAIRDLGTIGIIILILCSVVVLNYLTRQKSLKERMIEWRKQIEEHRETKGLDLLPWSLLERTKGSVKRGPTFAAELLLWDNKLVDLVGFMVPSEDFRKMKEFLLLPMPIACYFCQAPPPRDIILVQMEEGTLADLYNEPILLHGRLVLNQGPDTKFFYTIKDAGFGPGEKDIKLTLKSMSDEHAAHYRAAKLAEEMAKEKLIEGEAPPSAESLEEDKAAEMSRTAKENLLAAEIFLEENAKQDGIHLIEHSGGVQYEVLKEGAGRTPTIHGKVKTHYRGTLLDGTEFDNSYERGNPVVFGVNKVIPGWTDALLHMKEGDKWLLFIPPERAYGEKGMGKTIPPNSALIFELELLEVVE
ncbi:MAG TPA: FKBP-type peptidyl-prolyl cis-trans isomerase [Candidatus Hydrogenedentes bacterium]|nr:FKBP-type peptidyl-prolyl cis-trans isomerase [Candidatus Hydrogenedentota bacterium]HPG69159.1 FKBP-type peptidyl-prolyl cis-trans isomerase [Candidatus Hydrogenedentota bacterium]